MHEKLSGLETDNDTFKEAPSVVTMATEKFTDIVENKAVVTEYGDELCPETGDSTGEAKPISDIEEALTEIGFGFGTLLQILASYIVSARENMAVESLSLAALIVRCEWELSTFELTAIQGSGIICQLFVALIFSNVAENLGRKKLMLGGMVVMTVLGVLSGVFSQHLWQLILFSVLSGATLALTDPATTIYPGEITPLKWRVYAMFGIGIGWSMGSILTYFLAYFVMEPYGWQGLLIGCSVLLSPGIVLVLLARETPMFDLYRGNVKEAEKSVLFIGRLNRKKLSRPLGFTQQVHQSNGEENEGKTFRQLLKMLKQSGKAKDLGLLITLILMGVSVYACIGFSTPRFRTDVSKKDTSTSENDSCSFSKPELRDLGLVGFSEPMAVAISTFVTDKLGPRKATWLSGAVTLLCLIGLYFPIKGGVLVALLLVLRGSSFLLIFVPQVMLREHMPVSIRGFCFHLSYGAASIMTTLMVAITHFSYEVDPKVLVGIVQGLVLFQMILLFFFRSK